MSMHDARSGTAPCRPGHLGPDGLAGSVFDTRGFAVRRWVSELPTANIAELARRLHAAVRQVNRQAPPRAELFNFLEATGCAVELVLADLRHRHAQQPVHFGIHVATPADCSARLILELLRGYRSVLVATARMSANTRWRRLWFRRELATAVQRFIHYCGHLIQIHRVLHKEPPKAIWKRVHRCYRFAERRDILGQSVPCHGEGRGKTTISSEYKRLLLVSLLPTVLSPAQQRDVDVALDQWSDLLGFDDSAPDRKCMYLVEFDSGPLPVIEGRPAVAGARTRLLDMHRLHETLMLHLGRNGAGRWWLGEASQQTATLSLLHDCWCTAQRRNEMRFRVNLPAEVALGLGALVHLFGANPQARQPLVPPGSLALEPITEDDGNWLGKKEERFDPWALAYVSPVAATPTQATKSHPPAATGEPLHTTMRGLVMDRSGHGLSVVIARKAPRQTPLVGSPMAVRIDGKEWVTGIVKRLRDRGDRLEIGMQTLLREAVPARMVCRKEEQVSPPFDVLIGLTHDNYRAVAAPYLSGWHGGEPKLDVGGTSIRVTRGATLSHSLHADVFIIEMPDAEALKAIRAGARIAAETVQRRGAQRSAPRPHEREERIGELMTRTGLGRNDSEFIVDIEFAADDAPPRGSLDPRRQGTSGGTLA